MKKGATLRGEIQRIQNIPQQYQQGWTEFYKLRFKLTPDVLIPRPETELLVDEVLKFANSLLASRLSQNTNEQTSHEKRITILEPGTGSGCISISIAKNLPEAFIVASDISQKALDIAIKNAELNHISRDKVVFLQKNLLEGFVNAPDVIVANLPYIPTAKLMLIDPLVKDFEPKLALDGGIDGFELYRKMFAQIRDQNIYPKYLICEIEETQAETALAEAKRYFPNTSIEIKKDLAKKDRILKIIF